MTAKDPATAAAETAAKELVKVAYGDLVQPAAKEVGAELQQFVRAVMTAGRGFGYLIHETYKPFVLRALGSVPADRRIPPSPPLLGQILEGVSYETEGSEIYVMFQNLLSSSMDARKSGLMHPSFVAIIKTLSPDEARILKFLTHSPIHRVNVPRAGADGRPDNIIFYQVGDVGLAYPDNADFYMGNLFTHGLMDWDQAAQIAYKHEGQAGARTSLKLSLAGSRMMLACHAVP